MGTSKRATGLLENWSSTEGGFNKINLNPVDYVIAGIVNSWLISRPLK